jgi:DNA repair protein RadC
MTGVRVLAMLLRQAVERRLASAAQLLDVELVEYLFLAGDRYVSMKCRGDF